jgi:hypothetical protein
MNRPLRVLSWKGAWGEALLHGVSRITTAFGPAAWIRRSVFS